MGDYHILSASEDGNVISVAVHTVVPEEANAIGVSLRTALAQSGVGVSAVPFLPQAEADTLALALAAGQMIESQITLYTHPGETLIQKRARLDVLVRAEQTRALTVLRQRLWAWGYSRVIP